MTGTESTRAEWMREAYELGKLAAENAASWTVEAERCDPEAVRLTLQMMRDGDPRVDEHLPARPNLSGEWADSLTPRSLFEQVTGLDAHAEATWNVDAYNGACDALCDAYEQGVSEHFEAACERELMRYAS